MSQIPPQGYPGGGLPPGGYPPPGQAPGQMPGPYGQPGFSPMQMPRTSAAAVTSLVCGLLGCVPFITGIVAVITGIIGIGATGNPMKKGRGMAIAGLILGIISIGGWAVSIQSVKTWWSNTAPQRALGDQFLTALGNGDMTTAAGLCTDHVKPDQLQTAADQIKGWGGIQQKLPVFAAPSIAGQLAPVSGTFTSPNGQTHQYMLQTVNQNGAWKVDAFTMQ